MLRAMDLHLVATELLDALLPQRCVACERFGSALHLACLEAEPAASDEPRCGQCWRPGVASPCASCVAAPPAFEALRTPYRFEGAVRRALHEAKFRGVTNVLPLLGERAAAVVPEAWQPTMVVPVPLHRSRERERGYNQAALIGGAVACILGVPCEVGVLKRARATVPQATLRAATRAQNLTHAFECAPLPAGARVLLVDDVTTTGATFEACARALLGAGATAVFPLAVARED